MTEVEIKLAINDPEACGEALLENGFVFEKTVLENDTYYNSPAHDFRSLDEALRIRRTRPLMPAGDEVCCVTYKGPKLDAVSMTRKELESGVENPEVFEELFAALGLYAVLPVVKLRRYYRSEAYSMNACLDFVEGLGYFLELEILVESAGERSKALAMIEEVLQKLGYRMEDTTRTSYLTMLEEMG